MDYYVSSPAHWSKPFQLQLLVLQPPAAPGRCFGPRVSWHRSRRCHWSSPHLTEVEATPAAWTRNGVESSPSNLAQRPSAREKLNEINTQREIWMILRLIFIFPHIARACVCVRACVFVCVCVCVCVCVRAHVPVEVYLSELMHNGSCSCFSVAICGIILWI